MMQVLHSEADSSEARVSCPRTSQPQPAHINRNAQLDGQINLQIDPQHMRAELSRERYSIHVRARITTRPRNAIDREHHAAHAKLECL